MRFPYESFLRRAYCRERISRSHIRYESQSLKEFVSAGAKIFHPRNGGFRENTERRTPWPIWAHRDTARVAQAFESNRNRRSRLLWPGCPSLHFDHSQTELRMSGRMGCGVLKGAVKQYDDVSALVVTRTCERSDFNPR